MLIVDGLHYFNYTAAKFNHDVIQLPFWALAGFAFHRALRGGWLGHWLLLGLAIGMSMWAKYFVVVLAVPLALFLVFDEDARKALATPGPYIAAAVALVTMAPHLVWLVQNDFLPFAYAEHRALPSRGLIDHVWHPIAVRARPGIFPGTLGAHRHAAVFPAAEATEERRWRCIRPPHRRLARLRSDYYRVGDGGTQRARNRGDVGLPALSLSRPVGGAERAAKIRRRCGQARRCATWAAVFGCLAIAFIANYAILPNYDHRYRAVFFPGADLARELSQRYRAATGRPLIYVDRQHVGWRQCRPLRARAPARADRRQAGARALDRPCRPRSKGAVVVWTDGDLNAVPPGLRSVAVDAAVQPPFVLRDRRGESSINVGWAILYPKPSFAGSESGHGLDDVCRACRTSRRSDFRSRSTAG